MSGDQLLSIGEVAGSTGLTVSAVRYYNDVGLITEACRVGGKRRFEPETIARIGFVKRGQNAGFSLEEIGLMLDDRSGGWRDLVDAKLAELVQRRAGLDAMIETLRQVRACGCSAPARCRAEVGCIG